MGTYTTNYNLFMPSIGEQGWGDLVNGNFSTLDSTMKGLDTRTTALESADTAFDARLQPFEEHISFDSDGNIVGNVVGNVTGNLTGNVNGKINVGVQTSTTNSSLGNVGTFSGVYLHLPNFSGTKSLVMKYTPNFTIADGLTSRIINPDIQKYSVSIKFGISIFTSGSIQITVTQDGKTLYSGRQGVTDYDAVTRTITTTSPSDITFTLSGSCSSNNNNQFIADTVNVYWTWL